MLLKLSQEDQAAVPLARFVVRRYYELPQNLRSSLLIRLSQRDDCVGIVDKCVGRNFEKIPDDMSGS